MASQLEIFARALSRLIGWVYMACWSISFYPQPLLNWRRRSTEGLSIDFPTTNVLGFVCYSIYTGTFLYSPVVRSQYAARHPISPEPSVRFNDFAFAVHAVILSSLAYSQFFPSIWRFKVSDLQRLSRTVAGIFWGCVGSIVGITIWVVSTGGNDPFGWAWIDIIYTISYVKLVVTIIKYIPQAWLNYQRQSTVGWSIGQILLDFAGSILSILQLVIDSALQDDWSGITGNPIKLALGNVTIFFNVIFIVQHYILYRDNRVIPKDEEDGDNEQAAPLLVDNERYGTF